MEKHKILENDLANLSRVNLKVYYYVLTTKEPLFSTTNFRELLGIGGRKLAGHIAGFSKGKYVPLLLKCGTQKINNSDKKYISREQIWQVNPEYSKEDKRNILAILEKMQLTNVGTSTREIITLLK